MCSRLLLSMWIVLLSVCGSVWVAVPQGVDLAGGGPDRIKSTSAAAAARPGEPYAWKPPASRDPKCFEKLHELAAELAGYLSKIDTGGWSVAVVATPGEQQLVGGRSGLRDVVMALVDSASGLSESHAAKLGRLNKEGYLLHITHDRAHIVGNSVIALQHGMFDLLERLGCRFLTPAGAWTIVPDRKGTRLAESTTFEQPDFVSRRSSPRRTPSELASAALQDAGS